MFLAATASSVTLANPPAHRIPSGHVSAAPTCDDVTKLDIRNLVIRTAHRTFAFHNGIAVNYDSQLALGEGQLRPDWKAEIETDRVIRSAPTRVVRYLLIHDSHETGSGWHYYATGLVCSGRKLHEVFHRDGLDRDRLDEKRASTRPDHIR